MIPNNGNSMKFNQYWYPSFPTWKPLKNNKTSSVRVACAVGDRIRQGLRYDCELLLLNKNNPSSVLKYGTIDFLLVDSTILKNDYNDKTETESYQCAKDYLSNLCTLSHELNIPSVYWIIEDVTDFQQQADVADVFDLIYGASVEIIEGLRRFDVVAELLPPCIQPALSNPFRHFDHRDATKIDILYDGWHDLNVHPRTRNALKGLAASGLRFIDSQEEFISQDLIIPEGFTSESIIGRVTTNVKYTLLKYTQAYAASAETSKGAVKQVWDALEAASTRVPVVFFGEVPTSDIRKGFIVECTSEAEFLSEFVRFFEDKLYRQRVGHLAWRIVNKEHTFAHRLKAICMRLGIADDWEEHPKVSCITPTYRLDRIEECVKTFDAFNYPNKELILVANTDDMSRVRQIEGAVARPNVKVVQVPQELFAGAALNVGHTVATGKLCFRIDDDDDYGTNYLTDMVLGQRAIDADVFGKHSAALLMEGTDEVFAIKQQVEFLIHTPSSLASAKLRIGGNSVAGTSEIFSRIPYADSTYGAADSDFFFQIADAKGAKVAILDRFNCIATRRIDGNTHTWKASREAVLKSRYHIGNSDALTI